MNIEVLSGEDFECAYELLAAAIDRVGRAQESEFLVRLALLLMQAPVEIEAILTAISAAEAALV